VIVAQNRLGRIAQAFGIAWCGQQKLIARQRSGQALLEA
jgi:hypothetical protein